MESQKEEMINVAKKIVENINWMSFVNFDDQQVHSIMRMREIACGIVESRVKKVTTSDVDGAMLCSIENMVSSCRDVDGILRRLNSGVMENGHSQPVSRMKEIVSTVISNEAKLMASRNRNPVPIDMVDGVDAMTVESKVGLALVTGNKSIDIGGIQKRLFSNEEAEIEDKTGNQGTTMDGSLCLWAGDVQAEEVQYALVVNGEGEACNGEEVGMLIENVEAAAEGDLSADTDENALQETFNAIDGSFGVWDVQVKEEQFGVWDVQVKEEQHVSVVIGEAEACYGVQFGRAEGTLIENVEVVMEGMLSTDNGGVGGVQVDGEQDVLVDNREAEACNGVQFRHAEGLLIDNVEVVVEDMSSTDNDENAVQETFVSTYEPGVTAPVPLSVTWPADGKATLDWVQNVMTTLEQASKTLPPSDFQVVMPMAVVEELINAASSILSKEPNCVEVDCHKEDSKVIVVGDIHGQFHDLLNLLELAGLPSENQFYVFNGDYVDRGAWGLEVLLVLLAWKVLMPDRVYLLRGNHETKFCTSVYGFEEEVKTKFGDQGDLVYNKCLECFKELPLASIISSCVYTTHGGLFRSMNVGPLRRSKRKRVQKLELGSLEDLSKVNRYLIDVADEDPSVLTDVLWSDPSKKNGLLENGNRGLGLSWGPDCTEMFLKQSKLKLIMRSHQGPDARVDQDDFGDMLCGYSIDHVGESGKLYTLFSAPNYPQFGETKYNNEGAYAVLTPPNMEKPSFHSFKAVERPKPITSDSASQADYPAWMSSRVDFEALRLSGLPSWSVSLADTAGGTKVVEVPRAPSVEPLPLPLHSNLQETHRAAFEYLFELVAGLKHMLSTRMSMILE